VVRRSATTPTLSKPVAGTVNDGRTTATESRSRPPSSRPRFIVTIEVLPRKSAPVAFPGAAQQPRVRATRSPALRKRDVITLKGEHCAPIATAQPRAHRGGRRPTLGQPGARSAASTPTAVRRSAHGATSRRSLVGAHRARSAAHRSPSGARATFGATRRSALSYRAVSTRRGRPRPAFSRSPWRAQRRARRASPVGRAGLLGVAARHARSRCR
jgi:hypothetical protein